MLALMIYYKLFGPLNVKIITNILTNVINNVLSPNKKKFVQQIILCMSIMFNLTIIIK